MHSSWASKLGELRERRVPLPELLVLIHDLAEADVRDAEPDIVNLMRHEDPSVRSEAVCALSFHWILANYADDFARLLKEDPDDYVRGVAAVALGCVLQGAQTNWATKLLLQKVRDRLETQHVRRSAYDALLSVAIPPGSSHRLRAEASLRGIDRAYRKARERAKQRTKSGHEVYGTYDEVNRLWEALIDWDLLEEIERGT